MMEKYDAEKYRRSLRLRWWLMMGLSLAVLAFSVFNLVMLVVWDDRSYAIAGTISYMMLTVVQSNVVFTPRGVSVSRCLKDDQLLRRAWNEEHDERRMMICAKAGVPLIPIVSMVHYLLGLALMLVDTKVGGGILIASMLFMTVSNIQYTRWRKKLSEEETNDEL